MKPLADGRVLVALSGGPDSTALLIALQEAGKDVVAAHYDHALREGSDEVARRLADFCAARGIHLIQERRVEPLPKGSVQAAARALRYAFLERARIAADADVVAIAHTADDVVEGAVLHLLRGCGLAGFRGMPERRGHYVRPWLGVWRKDVHTFLRERGIDAYEDPANRDPRFARVRVRTQVLPALEHDRPGIIRRIHAAAANASRLQRVIAAEADGIVAAGAVDAQMLRGLPEPVAMEVLRRLYVTAGGFEPGLGRAHLLAMLRLAGEGKGGRGVDLPGELRFRIVGGHLQVISAHRDLPTHRLEVRECRGCDDSGVTHLRPGLDLSLGYRRPGLRIKPSGGRGTRKLQDLFVDARVPREDRDAWPLVFAGDRLAWVPGVAVDADLSGRPGEPSLHVTVSPFPDGHFPANSRSRLVSLELPDRPSGDQI